MNHTQWANFSTLRLVRSKEVEQKLVDICYNLGFVPSIRSIFYHTLVIGNKEGKEISLTANSFGLPNHLYATIHVPTNKKIFFPTTLPHITVSLSKSSSRVIKEIEARLLSKCNPIWKDAAENERKHAVKMTLKAVNLADKQILLPL